MYYDTKNGPTRPRIAKEKGLVVSKVYYDIS
jgi:hypothetical protein